MSLASRWRQARVAAGGVAGRRRRHRRVPVEPAPHAVGVELLAPHEARGGLAQDPHPFDVEVSAGREGAVELVGVPLASRDRLGEGRRRPRRGGARGARHGGLRAVEAEPELRTPAAGDGDSVPPGGLRPGRLRVHGRRAGDHVVVDAVLREWRDRRVSVEPGRVRLVVAEERLGRAARAGRGLQAVAVETRVVDRHRVAIEVQRGDVGGPVPAPGVAEPERRQDVQRRLVGTVVLDVDLDQDLGRRCLGVGDLHDPEAPVVEDAGVDELVLRLARGRAGRSRRRGRRTGTAPAGSGSASGGGRGWAGPPSTTSTPWRPRRGCPRARSGRTSAP